MKLNEYQELSKRTMPAEDHDSMARFKENLANYGMGLSGEAGETTDALKKFIFHDHHLDTEKVTEEIGDVLHYAAGLCSIIGVDLEDAANANIDKLKRRYPEGFSEKASRERVE